MPSKKDGKKKRFTKKEREYLTKLAASRVAELLYLSYLEQKGLDPKKYPLSFPGPESIEAVRRASAHTDDPSEDREAVE